MKKKFNFMWIVYALMFLVTVWSASASVNLTNGLVSYWAFNETSGTTASDEVNSNDGTLTNGASFTTGKINNGVLFDGVNDYVNIPHNSNLVRGTGNFTYSFWATGDNSNINGHLIDKRSGSGSTFQVLAISQNTLTSGFSATASKKLSVGFIMAGTSDGMGWVSDNDVFDGTFKHIVVVRTGTRSIKVYVDGSEITMNTVINSGSATSLSPSGALTLGSVAGVAPYKGKLDELGFWNRALSSDEISALNNGGSGFAYPFVAPVTDSFSITLRDKNTSASINTFKVDVNGTVYSTTNGSVVTNINESGLVNLIFYEIGGSGTETHFDFTVDDVDVSSNYVGEAEQFILVVKDVFSGVSLNGSIYVSPEVCVTPPCSLELGGEFVNGVYKGVLNSPTEKTRTVLINSPDYFNETFTNQNLLTPLSVNLIQSYLDINTFELVSNNSLTNFNFTLNTSGSSYNQDDLPLSITAGSHLVTISVNDYYTVNKTINIEPLTTYTLNAELGNVNLNISLKDVILNDLITFNSYIEINNSAGFFLSYNNTNGSFTNIKLLKGNYTIKAWADNYAFFYENISLNESQHNYTYLLYANNSVWITAKDSNTGISLTGFEVQIFNAENSYSGNDSSTGTAMFSNITSGVYIVKVIKDAYATGEYTLTMTGGSHQTLTAFLISEPTTSIFTITNIVTGTIIIDALVSMYANINNVWVLISSQNSDITGRVQITYETGKEYKFVIGKEGYTTREFFLKPLFSTYTVRLTPDVESLPDINIGSWIYSISNQGLFYYNELNEFTINFFSGMGTIEYIHLNITDHNNETWGITCLNAIGCSVDYSINITSVDLNNFILVEYWIKESGRTEKYFRHNYLIQNIYSNKTLYGWKDNEDVGSLEKAFLAMLITLIIVGVVAGVSVMLGVPPVTPSGFVLALTVEVLAFVNFIPSWSAHMIALGCVLIILFGRGQI